MRDFLIVMENPDNEEDTISFTIWADYYEEDKFDYNFYDNESIVVEIGKDIVLEVIEGDEIIDID